MGDGEDGRDETVAERRNERVFKGDQRREGCKFNVRVCYPRQSQIRSIVGVGIREGKSKEKRNEDGECDDAVWSRGRRDFRKKRAR